MRDFMLALIVFTFWISGAAGLYWYAGPEFLASGRPELVLLAYLLPIVWVVAVLVAWIALADLGWREEYDGLASPFEPDLDTPRYRGMIGTT